VFGNDDQIIEVGGGGEERDHVLPFSRTDIYDTDYTWDDETGILTNNTTILWETPTDTLNMQSKFKKTFWFDSDDDDMAIAVPRTPIPSGHNPGRTFKLMKYAGFDGLAVTTSIVKLETLPPAPSFAYASSVFLSLEYIYSPFNVTEEVTETDFFAQPNFLKSFTELLNTHDLSESGTVRQYLENPEGFMSIYAPSVFNETYGVSVGVGVNPYFNPAVVSSTSIDELELKLLLDVNPSIMILTAPP